MGGCELREVPRDPLRFGHGIVMPGDDDLAAHPVVEGRKRRLTRPRFGPDEIGHVDDVGQGSAVGSQIQSGGVDRPHGGSGSALSNL